MNELSAIITSMWGTPLASEFKPCACYYRQLDAIEYRAEDVITISERIDPFLTIIWNEERSNLVGFKLKGFRWVFNKLRDLNEELGNGLNIEEKHFNPMISVLQHLLTQLGNEMFAAGAEIEKQQRKTIAYKNVISLITQKDVRFSEEELLAAA